MTRSVVLGIGNVLLSDDGAGVHAARQLECLLKERAGVQVIDGGTLSFTLAPVIESAERLIVIDAAQLHAAPGTVRTYLGADFDTFIGKPKLTVHEVSLVDLLDIARLTDAVPAERAIVAVQPQCATWGDSLTRDVDAAVPEILARVMELLERWPGQPGPPAAVPS